MRYLEKYLSWRLETWSTNRALSTKDWSQSSLHKASPGYPLHHRVGISNVLKNPTKVHSTPKSTPYL